MKSPDIKMIKRLLPVRKNTDNKTAGGKCLIIAGSELMPGAARLAAKAAARMGAGYVYIAVDFKKKPKLLDPDFLPVDINKKINFANFSSIAIGPGLGHGPRTVRLLKNILKSGASRVVIDADAITALADHQTLLPLPSDWIITPHAGELSKVLLLKKSLRADERKGILNRAQKKIGCILLLKGNPTYLSDGSQSVSVKYGNKALAKAGTGDVLTGMIAGFLSQNCEPFNAAVAAASIHGLIADEWIKSNDYLSLMASDIIEAIPRTLTKIRNLK
jgi:NAD(P)H-hydrate epimerase